MFCPPKFFPIRYWFAPPHGWQGNRFHNLLFFFSFRAQHDPNNPQKDAQLRRRSSWSDLSSFFKFNRNSNKDKDKDNNNNNNNNNRQPDDDTLSDYGQVPDGCSNARPVRRIISFFFLVFFSCCVLLGVRENGKMCTDRFINFKRDKKCSRNNLIWSSK